MVKKAIIPVAGFGTRFLPASKAQPKEMLPVVDKPVLQYIVEEAVDSGIEEIIFSINQNKRAIEDHFDSNFELEYNLAQQNKNDILAEIRKIPLLAKFSYVRSRRTQGEGDAIRQAVHLIGDEPCAIFFGDDIVEAKTPCMRQLIQVYEKYQDPVVAVMPVSPEEIPYYGIIDGIKIQDRIYQINAVIEKPSPEEAPSNLAIIGKYIITPDVFKTLLDPTTPYPSGEIRLADALDAYVKNRPIYGYEFIGKRFDCGTKVGLIKANIHFGLKHKDTKEELKKFISKL